MCQWQHSQLSMWNRQFAIMFAKHACVRKKKKVCTEGKYVLYNFWVQYHINGKRQHVCLEELLLEADIEVRFEVVDTLFTSVPPGTVCLELSWLVGRIKDHLLSRPLVCWNYGGYKSRKFFGGVLVMHVVGSYSGPPLRDLTFWKDFWFTAMSCVVWYASTPNAWRLGG